MAILGNLGNYRNFGLLVMRVGLGIMFVLHGYPKMIGGPKMWIEIGGSMKFIGITFAPIFWGFMAAATETFGGFLLVLGLAFRPVCLMLTFTMLIAALMHLGTGGGIAEASHAIELGLVFIGLAFVGPGKYSVDKK